MKDPTDNDTPDFINMSFYNEDLINAVNVLNGICTVEGTQATPENSEILKTLLSTEAPTKRMDRIEEEINAVFHRIMALEQGLDALLARTMYLEAQVYRLTATK